MPSRRLGTVLASRRRGPPGGYCFEITDGSLAVMDASVAGGVQPGLGDFHVLGVVAPADADGADDPVVTLDRIATPEDHEAVDGARRTSGQRRVVLDEVVPGVGGQPEARRGVGLVLGDLHTEKGGAVHAAERLEDTAFIYDGDDERMAHLVRLG